ncbi:hypothetical protein MNV49_001372 [Pseudohyphozyma bogoriensis]|nr:hypothetical protein MNV49_001372 [Pseudohyphozyma bogoriensis]
MKAVRRTSSPPDPPPRSPTHLDSTSAPHTPLPGFARTQDGYFGEALVMSSGCRTDTVASGFGREGEQEGPRTEHASGRDAEGDLDAAQETDDATFGVDGLDAFASLSLGGDLTQDLDDPHFGLHPTHPPSRFSSTSTDPLSPFPHTPFVSPRSSLAGNDDDSSPYPHPAASHPSSDTPPFIFSGPNFTDLAIALGTPSRSTTSDEDEEGEGEAVDRSSNDANEHESAPSPIPESESFIFPVAVPPILRPSRSAGTLPSPHYRFPTPSPTPSDEVRGGSGGGENGYFAEKVEQTAGERLESKKSGVWTSEVGGSLSGAEFEKGAVLEHDANGNGSAGVDEVDVLRARQKTLEERAQTAERKVVELEKALKVATMRKRGGAEMEDVLREGGVDLATQMPVVLSSTIFAKSHCPFCHRAVTHLEEWTTEHWDCLPRFQRIVLWEC